MKKLILLFCFLFTRRSFSVGGFTFALLFTIHFSSAQGIWTWMSGTDSLNASGVFGKQGIPSVNNHPPASYSSFCWTDLQGNFWLYGGYNTSNRYGDLWRFNPTTLEWTWINGTGVPNQSAIYGAMGVAAPGNTPGSRWYSSCTWVDTSGNLWLYGGNSQLGFLADLWKFNIVSNEWTWVSGPTSVYQVPVYGTQGVPSQLNNPGGRDESGIPWVDVNGKFWLYGGDVSLIGSQSDMWMYDPITNMWAWESGSQGTGIAPTYGSKGIFSVGNTPGSRFPYAMITENNGNFLLFGGSGGSFGILYSDLWEYNPSNNLWSWINGAQGNKAPGFAGTSCQSDSTFYPNARLENRSSWKDCIGNFWIYGGFIRNDSIVGDVWVFLSATKKWARMSDSSYINASPVYGTLGVQMLSNQPGSRMGTANWKDKKGNFWIFGGFNNNYQSYGDMWRYIPDSICVNSKCDIATSINTFSPLLFSTLQLYPNPASNNINLSVDGIEGNYQLKIYNVLGQLVGGIHESPLRDKQIITIPLDNLPDGTYQLILTNGNQYFSKRFVHIK